MFAIVIETTSPVFNMTDPERKQRRIPKAHTCTKLSMNEPNISPPLEWSGAPEGTQGFALIMHSTEPVGSDEPWVHWVIWNLPTDLLELPEGIEHSKSLTNGASQGTNDKGAIGYLGPCPSVIVIGQEGIRSAGVFKKQDIEKYTFRIYALDVELDLQTGATKAELLAAMEGHVLAGAVLVGERQGPTAFEKTKF